MRFFKTTRSGHHSDQQRTRKTRLSVEPLESRTLLSVTIGDASDVVEMSSATHTAIQTTVAVQSSSISGSSSATSVVSTPSSYDLRSYGDVTSVKNQGNYGTCWAFASYASLESSILKASNTTTDLSERNLAYKHGFDYGIDDGGNSYMSEAYLSRFSGPISESDDPYSRMGAADGVTGPAQYYVREMLRFDNQSEMKTALMTYGALYTGMYWDSAYYRSSDCTYYYSGAYTNHAVTIVGWDDSKATAGGTGAWLVKNSWGTGWADGGYFWLSYQDSGGHWGESFCGAVAASNYSKAYYYDTFGDVGDLNTPYAFNKYTATSASLLKSVGFFTEADGANYTITVYSSYSGGRLSGSLGTVSGTESYAGYHTVDLTSAISLSAGQDFYVSLHITNGGAYCMAVDYRYAGYSSASTALVGQSYYSFNGTTWTDLTNYNSTANFCIKALVQETTAPTPTPTPTPTTTISNVVVNTTNSAAKTSLTWQVADNSGIRSTKLTIDGRNMSVRRTSGNSYAASYSASASLAAGVHTFTITVVNAQRVSQTYTGTITVAPTLPTISNTSVKVTSSTGKATLSWKVSDCDGIASTTATIDGQTVNVGRKSGNRTTANYAASSILAAGVHTYTITAIDAQGVSNTYTGSFTITMSGRRYTVRSGGVPQATAKADWLIDCGAFRGSIVAAAHRQAGVDAVFAAY